MNSKMTHVHIFGMFCSGTNHLNKTLRLNLASLPGDRVTEGFVGWKHDDIWSPSGFVDKANTRIHYEDRVDPDVLYHSLCIVIYRNPLTWFQSLFHSPHQAPALVELDFSTFIRSPYEGFWVPEGEELSVEKDRRTKLIRADRIRERYPNLATMRRTKIQLFESFKYRVPNVAYINLETLVDQPEETLRVIANHFDIELRKEFHVNTQEKHSRKKYEPKQYAMFSREDVAYALRSLSMLEEAGVGYSVKSAYSLAKRGIRPRYPDNIGNVFSLKRQVRVYSYEYGDATVELSSAHHEGGTQ